MKTELSPFGIQIATVNPGFYATGFNDRGVDAASHWFDPKKNFTPMEAFSSAAKVLAQQLDPQLMANTIVDVVLAEKPRFRNVLPKETEDLIKQVQRDTWEAKA